MGWYGNDMGTGGWVLMIAVMALFWGLVILGGVMIFRGRSDRGRGGGAREILDGRFARGEIDREEYEARKDALRGGSR